MSKLQEINLEVIKEHLRYRHTFPDHACNLLKEDNKQREWLLLLVEQLEQAQAEVEQARNKLLGIPLIKELHDENMKFRKELQKLQAENEQLKADKQKYERELEWYGKIDNYKTEYRAEGVFMYSTNVRDDGGQRARQVLSEVKGNG